MKTQYLVNDLIVSVQIPVVCITWVNHMAKHCVCIYIVVEYIIQSHGELFWAAYGWITYFGEEWCAYVVLDGSVPWILHYDEGSMQTDIRYSICSCIKTINPV